MELLSKKIVVTCFICKSMYKVSGNLLGKPVSCSKCKRTFLIESAVIKQSSAENEGLFLCKLALNYGLIDEKQLEKVLTEYTQKTSGSDSTAIETLMLTMGVVNEDTLSLLKDIRENWELRIAEKKYAAEIVKEGLITKEAAREILVKQAIHFSKTRNIKLVGEFLIESGVLTESQHKKILSYQSSTKDKKKTPFQVPEKISSAPFPDNNQADKIIKKATEPSPTQEKTESAPIRSPENKTKKTIPEPPPKKTPTTKETQATAIPDDAVTQKPPQTEPPETIPEQAQIPISDEQPETTAEPVPKDTRATPETTESARHVPEPEALEPQEAAEADDTHETFVISGLELVISPDKTIALLRAPKDMQQTSATVEEIRSVLNEKEIIYGVVEDALITGFLNSKIFREKPFKIAEGRPPKPGVKGSVKYHFDTDYLKVGAMSDSGTIDFKDRGEIPHIKAGALLAEITPDVPGKNGIDIYGRDLLVPEIPKIDIRCDSGADYSEDRKKIYATIDGQPKLNFGDRISVLSELKIPGDVGYDTGHVDFQGNIVINGTIQNDFNVKGGTIEANEILAATINASGDLHVAGGINGATISVQGNVTAKFIHKSTIKAFGDIIVQKEIIDCKFENSGGCYIDKGKIITSEIASKQGIEALEIGTEMSGPCTLKIGVDDHIAAEVEKIDLNITTSREKLEEIKQTIENREDEEKGTHKSIADLAHVQDRSQLEQKALKESLETLKKEGKTAEVAEVEKKIEALNTKAREADNSINEFFDRQDSLLEEIEELRRVENGTIDRIDMMKREKKDLINWSKKIKAIPTIKVAKSIFAGTSVIGANTSRIIKETMRKVRIREITSQDAPDGWEIKID